MIRQFARFMLAGVHVYDGAQALVSPQEYTHAVENFLHRSKVILPKKYATYLPSNPKATAQALAATRVAAGGTMGFGILSRLSAGVLALSSLPLLVGRDAFWETQDRDEERERRQGFLVDAALAGATLITALDTQGNPSVLWRSKKAAQDAADSVKSATAKAGNALRNAADTAVDSAQDATENLATRIGL